MAASMVEPTADPWVGQRVALTAASTVVYSVATRVETMVEKKVVPMVECSAV